MRRAGFKKLPHFSFFFLFFVRPTQESTKPTRWKLIKIHMFTVGLHRLRNHDSR